MEHWCGGGRTEACQESLAGRVGWREALTRQCSPRIPPCPSYKEKARTDGWVPVLPALDGSALSSARPIDPEVFGRKALVPRLVSLSKPATPVVAAVASPPDRSMLAVSALTP